MSEKVNKDSYEYFEKPTCEQFRTLSMQKEQMFLDFINQPGYGIAKHLHAPLSKIFPNVFEEIIKSTDKLYASGGGVKNPQIMKEIQKRVPGNIKVTTSAEIGIPPEYKEAIKFATIAYSTIHCVPGNIPAAGHASQYAILGKIAVAPRHIKGGPQL